ncbi:DinB family protein [Amycolatopsis sp. CA-230715]|uniref:DinB family protein n=1 Tax=Amycolatopsis sp. CA-230715 TaxID=2745196 RepID=UPI001C01DA9E|nr:DinB family protein [Amycolatopsis sp. CA-230715]QWF80794.1 hypothetical protein HUW46_04218 [Amycolatopsis sp. CA-230715]
MATRRADMFLDLDQDPREDGPRLGDERGTLTEYLRLQRLTLEIKCGGLDAAALARRAVEPSSLSLLGLVRHLAEMERMWFRTRMAALDVPKLFCTEDAPDGDFDGAIADPLVVEEAWRLWREETAFTDRFVADAPDLGLRGHDPHFGAISLREVLVHLIEEYARHNGHADLLRERIDGRIGQ